jgi:hypothetical protein
LSAGLPASEAFVLDDVLFISSLTITNNHAVKSQPLPDLASGRFHSRALRQQKQLKTAQACPT